MTTQARIAAFLSTSALCLGLAAAPAVHAAPQAAQASATKSGKHKAHAQKPGARKADAHAPAAAAMPTPAK